MSTAQPPKLEPPEVPMVPVALGGMAVWLVAGLILLGFRSTLEAHGHGNWITVCVVGFLLGVAGLPLMAVHDANQRRRRAARDAAEAARER